MNQYDELGAFALCNARRTTPGKRCRGSASRRAAAGNLIWCWAVVITWLTLLCLTAGLATWLCVHCQH